MTELFKMTVRAGMTITNHLNSIQSGGEDGWDGIANN